jgi:hypothetical protein
MQGCRAATAGLGCARRPDKRLRRRQLRQLDGGRDRLLGLPGLQQSAHSDMMQHPTFLVRSRRSRAVAGRDEPTDPIVVLLISHWPTTLGRQRSDGMPTKPEGRCFSLDTPAPSTVTGCTR